MKNLLILALISLVLSCQKKSQQINHQPKDSSVLAPFMESAVARDTLATQLIKLSWSRNENMQSIQSLKIYETLSPADQQRLIDKILSMVPKIDPTHQMKLSLLDDPDNCDTVDVGTAKCPSVIDFVYMKCPVGTVFDSDRCLCDFPINVNDNNPQRCYTFFMYSDGQAGQFSLMKGRARLHAVGTYGGWCDAGCTAYVPHN